jgi:hypothetical protein
VPIDSRVVTISVCDRCNARDAALVKSQQRIEELVREVAVLKDQLREALKITDLQGADLERWRELVARLQPNRPERVPSNVLQLAFEQLLASLPTPPANSTTDEAPNEPPAHANPESKGNKEPRSGKHGRRALDKTHLPVREIVLDPDEVIAVGGEGWELIGAESSERLAKQTGGYIRVRMIRRTWVRKASIECSALSLASELLGEVPGAHIVTAALPESVWPNTMGDASAVANVIVSKYDDSLPLHRQEKISARDGFKIPRSTQCDWLDAAHKYTYRVVEAMMAEGVSRSQIIATDATGAPVRAPGECRDWHVFVFIMEHDHVVFRHRRHHDKDAIRSLLPGYRGFLVADAAGIYDHLYRDHGLTEAGDWSHVRRYFWKAIPTDRTRAHQGIALIRELFQVEQAVADVSPEERLRVRRERSAPLVDLFERWLERERPHVKPRTPIDAAFGYASNLQGALRRFLDDGRLPIHNNASEAALRNLVLGRSNWMWFENETGLSWYCTFRSLIASCALHGINAGTYLEQLLRIAPHWPSTRMLELSPKYWARTLAGLDERHRRIITPPWELDPASLAVEWKPRRRATATAA